MAITPNIGNGTGGYYFRCYFHTFIDNLLVNVKFNNTIHSIILQKSLPYIFTPGLDRTEFSV